MGLNNGNFRFRGIITIYYGMKVDLPFKNMQGKPFVSTWQYFFTTT
jgi:hypothetical protein